MTSAVIVAGYGRRVFSSWLTGWSWGLTLFANQAVAPLIGLAIWTQAAPGRSDVVTYFAALLIVTRFTPGYGVHTFSGMIYDGNLTDALLRPHSPVLGQVGWYFGIAAFDLLFLAPVVLALAVLLSVRPVLDDVVLAIPSLAIACAMAFAFDFAVACSAFWTQRYFAVADAAYRLLFLFGGVAAPIPLLPDDVRPWFDALPFRWMRGYPAEIASGFVDRGDVGRGHLVQLGWLAGMATIAFALYRRGIRRFTAIGG